MQKKHFVNLFRQKLLSAMPQKFGGRLSAEDTMKILDLHYETILDVIKEGGEVRYSPIGRWSPKPIHRGGKITNVKVGFTSYNKTDMGVKEAFIKLLGKLGV